MEWECLKNPNLVQNEDDNSCYSSESSSLSSCSSESSVEFRIRLSSSSSSDDASNTSESDCDNGFVETNVFFTSTNLSDYIIKIRELFLLLQNNRDDFLSHDNLYQCVIEFKDILAREYYADNTEKIKDQAERLSKLRELN